MEKDTYNIRLTRNIQCTKCVYGVILNPYDSYCVQYKLKPQEVLYEGKDCPYFKKSLYIRPVEEEPEQDIEENGNAENI